MARVVRFSRLAETDLVKGFYFYEEISQGLGGQFIDSMESEISELSEKAGIHPISHPPLMKMVAQRFPFLVFYRLEDDQVRGEAVLYGRMDPEKILRTLRSR